MAVNFILHLAPILTASYSIIVALRFIAGIGQVVGYCYFCSWVDQFGIQKYKVMFTTIIQLAGNFGTVWGHLLNAIFSSEQWKFALILESTISSILIICSIPQRTC